jgi:hypothetical protein
VVKRVNVQAVCMCSCSGIPVFSVEDIGVVVAMAESLVVGWRDEYAGEKIAASWPFLATRCWFCL